MPRKPPAQPAWPAESWPPLVLFGKSPSWVSVLRAHERRAFALRAEAEVLELQHRRRPDSRRRSGRSRSRRAARRPARRGRRGRRASRRAAAPGRRRRRCGARSRRARSTCGEAELARARLAHHQEGLGAGARHDAVEQVDRLGDRPRVEVLLDRQRHLEQRVRVLQRVGALGDGDAAEVLARRAVRAHVGGGDEGEDRVRPARAVRVAGVAREVREAAEHLPERLDVVGVGGDAGDDVGVARLHRARGAAQRHHARGAAGRDVVEPARRQAQVLGHADGGVGREREAADGEAVDLAPWRCPSARPAPRAPGR